MTTTNNILKLKRFIKTKCQVGDIIRLDEYTGNGYHYTYFFKLRSKDICQVEPSTFSIQVEFLYREDFDYFLNPRNLSQSISSNDKLRKATKEEINLYNMKAIASWGYEYK